MRVGGDVRELSEARQATWALLQLLPLGKEPVAATEVAAVLFVVKRKFPESQWLLVSRKMFTTVKEPIWGSVQAEDGWSRAWKLECCVFALAFSFIPDKWLPCCHFFNSFHLFAVLVPLAPAPAQGNCLAGILLSSRKVRRPGWDVVTWRLLWSCFRFCQPHQVPTQAVVRFWINYQVCRVEV